MRNHKTILCAVFLALCFTRAEALDLKINDLSAAVEVLPAFSVSMDNPNLVFGIIKPGEQKILGEGRFFNEIKCRSNSGRPWFLKAHLISLRMLKKEYTLTPASLKWKIVESTGSAQPLNGFEFKAFSNEPSLVYASQGDDNAGKEVVLRFQYSIDSPLGAPEGNYAGQVIFTMAESP